MAAGWLAVEDLFGVQSPLAGQFRGSSQPNSQPSFQPGGLRQIAEGEIRRAKLLNFGVQLGEDAIALIMVLSRCPDEPAGDRITVRVQVYPLGEYLPPQLQLALISETGQTLQSVTARAQDLWMQLPAFKVQPDHQFSLQASLGEIRFSETFSA